MMDNGLRRHEYSAELCDRLERMSWGACAREILDSRPQFGNCSIATLPLFAWDRPDRDAGRKTRSATGELLLPVKIKWRGTPGSVVLLHAREKIELSWTASGGSEIPSRGKTCVVPAEIATIEAHEVYRAIPKVINAASLSRMETRRTLSDLASDGRNAQWEILRIFEENLRWNFERALRSVKTELGLGSFPVVDESAGEMIQNNILLGDEGSDDSLALRLINRCLEGEAFSRVDPERYVRRALFSAAETGIRRHIGDPHIGRKVRRVAEEINSDDADLVAEEFARQNPKSHVGSRRTKDALTAPQRVAAATQAFSFGEPFDVADSDGRGKRS